MQNSIQASQKKKDFLTSSCKSSPPLTSLRSVNDKEKPLITELRNEGVDTILKAFKKTASRNSSLNMLGTRDPTQKDRPYVWKTWSEVAKITESLAYGKAIVHTLYSLLVSVIMPSDRRRRENLEIHGNIWQEQGGMGNDSSRLYVEFSDRGLFLRHSGSAGSRIRNRLNRTFDDILFW